MVLQGQLPAFPTRATPSSNRHCARISVVGQMNVDGRCVVHTCSVASALTQTIPPLHGAGQPTARVTTPLHARCRHRPRLVVSTRVPPFSTLLLHTPPPTPTRSPRQSVHDDPEAASTSCRSAVGACELMPRAVLCMPGRPYTMTPHAAALLALLFSTVIPAPAPTPTPTRSSLFSLFPSPQAPGTTTTIVVVSSSDAAQRSAAHSRLRSPVFQACCIATF
ncbi:hypothetical protein DFH08DRAFT_976172 [Mycena albidolilacea]|uniref:Uncharacterized protein n=1 Tax=Mycena albidolilacea TaxID=1033008 RepID=A0AAD6Z454_9AGAR|nr:hypothetical protein DFH08DRAFT_976172 [Mycena albidolilacea]